MMTRDPALIISLARARHGGPISTQHADLLTRIDLLPTGSGFTGTIATFALGARLWEQCRDPGRVDKVEC